MKKIVVLVCVVLLVLAISTAAMATETNWVVKFRAGNLVGTVMNNATTDIIAATATASTSAAANPGNVKANIASYVGSSYYGTQRLASAAGANAPYTYNLTLAVGTLYAGDQVYITAWSPLAGGLISSSANLPANYQVSLYTGTTAVAENLLHSWSAAELNVASDPAQTSSIGFWYTASAHSDTYAGGDKFTVVVGPVPEPGSMLALGTGLVGMLGFAIRRRRA